MLLDNIRGNNIYLLSVYQTLVLKYFICFIITLDFAEFVVDLEKGQSILL